MLLVEFKYLRVWAWLMQQNPRGELAPCERNKMGPLTWIITTPLTGPDTQGSAGILLYLSHIYGPQDTRRKTSQDIGPETPQ